MYLRGGGEKQPKKWKEPKEPMWDHFNIAMSHAPQEIKDQNIAVDQARGSRSD